ncbi:hypothetical protein G9F72_005375 [Clostridium estertheticum]|uniref:hypothetical protein n=1 Tax=Clostridium estertheticum TaxID=238834 RepID=UPI001CD18E25|nr:hypothetical protein [Clostridium estertheticum]MBZ9685776.1 hypothetical protein [Clostridium estertheticum]
MLSSIRVFNYPYAALEEAIVNAVYHRSYEVREPIEIRIDAEKIIILNYRGIGVGTTYVGPLATVWGKIKFYQMETLRSSTSIYGRRCF